MVWLDNDLKLYANRTIANLTHAGDPSGNRTAHPYSCDPPTAACPALRQLPWEYRLYNLSVDEAEAHDLVRELPAVATAMNRSLWAFAASVVLSQGPRENNCAENFPASPPM